MATKNAISSLVLSASLVWTSLGCGSLRVNVPVKPPPALLFEKFSAPIETNFEGTAVGSKVGTSSASFIYVPLLTGISFTWGDADLRTASENANITTVHYADYQVLSVLGIYVQIKTKVSGD